MQKFAGVPKNLCCTLQMQTFSSTVALRSECNHFLEIILVQLFDLIFA